MFAYGTSFCSIYVSMNKLWPNHQQSLMLLCTCIELENVIVVKASKWHHAATCVAGISPDISHSLQLCLLASHGQRLAL